MVFGVRALLCVPTYLVASLCAPAVSSAQQTTGAGPLPIVRGRVFVPDSGEVAGLRVIADWGTTADTVAVEPGGQFTLPRRESLGDGVALVVAAASAAEARYQRATVRLPKERLGREVRVVLIPRAWRIGSGPYAGDVVAIDPSLVLHVAEPDHMFARLSSQRMVVGWLPELFPIPLAFRHESPTWRHVSPRDSMAFWAVVNRMHEDLGHQLFRPANESDVDHGVYGVDVRVDPALRAEGLTFVTWTGEGNIFEGSVSLRRLDFPLDEVVVVHELLHALGFRHTSAWRSVMQPRAPSSQRHLTREDVAYTQLLMRIRQVQLEMGRCDEGTEGGCELAGF